MGHHLLTRTPTYTVAPVVLVLFEFMLGIRIHAMVWVAPQVYCCAPRISLTIMETQSFTQKKHNNLEGLNRQ
jgi:hypothetical protein